MYLRRYSTYTVLVGRKSPPKPRIIPLKAFFCCYFHHNFTNIHKRHLLFKKKKVYQVKKMYIKFNFYWYVLKRFEESLCTDIPKRFCRLQKYIIHKPSRYINQTEPFHNTVAIYTKCNLKLYPFSSSVVSINPLVFTCLLNTYKLWNQQYTTSMSSATCRFTEVRQKLSKKKIPRIFNAMFKQ